MVETLLVQRLGWPLVYLKPSILVREFTKPHHGFHFPYGLSLTCSSKYRGNPFRNRIFVRSEGKNVVTSKTEIETSFFALKEECSWETGNLWSVFSFYIFTLHIPLSFGGLSAIAQIRGRPQLDGQTQAVCLLIIQILELYAALLFLKHTVKPRINFTNFFNNNKLVEDRNWLLASALGFGFLVFLVFFTSLIADRLFGPKAVNDPIVKVILLKSDISRVVCVLVYSIVTPLLEEIVYRRFLLTSLCSSMEWQQALVIGSLLFSAVHFSAANFLQLFIIVCVLGASYCWTGNLKSSLLIHSLYNAFNLMITYFY